MPLTLTYITEPFHLGVLIHIYGKNVKNGVSDNIPILSDFIT